jgi:predicted enzyme related to lactoylglutathione lyase
LIDRVMSIATIVHFDVPAEDLERASNFYKELFGWKIERMSGPMEYHGISTLADDGGPGVNGGMGRRSEGDTGMMNYFGVGSIDATAARVMELGGKVIMPKTDVPGYGCLAIYLDTEGDRFGLWEDL